MNSTGTSKGYGITAIVTVPVGGLFEDAADGLSARNKFADYIASIGLCGWLSSQGAQHEWTVGFYRITDIADFRKAVIEYLAKLNLKNGFNLIVYDASLAKIKV